MNKQYKSLYGILYVYWTVYGGFRAVFGSPYLHIALLITAGTYPLWIKSNDWAAITLGALPNILGFSIGAFAVILSFGQDSLERLKDKDEAKSRYLGVIASFVHFIVMQTLALLVAFVGKAWNNPYLGFFGTVITIYAMVLAVAGAFRLFRLARVYNQMTGSPKPESKDHNQ